MRALEGYRVVYSGVIGAGALAPFYHGVIGDLGGWAKG